MVCRLHFSWNDIKSSIISWQTLSGSVKSYSWYFGLSISRRSRMHHQWKSTRSIILFLWFIDALKFFIFLNIIRKFWNQSVVEDDFAFEKMIDVSVNYQWWDVGYFLNHFWEYSSIMKMLTYWNAPVRNWNWSFFFFFRHVVIYSRFLISREFRGIIYSQWRIQMH